MTNKKDTASAATGEGVAALRKAFVIRRERFMETEVPEAGWEKGWEAGD